MLKRKASDHFSTIYENSQTGLSCKQYRGNYDEFEEISKKCWLFILPNEILEHIFRFLPPNSLLEIEKLNCERFDNCTSKIRVADFTSCNHMDLVDIQKFFSRNRTRYITEINFNNMIYVNTSDLVKVISKCKSLTTLSVINCHFSLLNIYTIQKYCKKLEKLHWYVDFRDDTSVSILDSSPLLLKTLYLHTKKDGLKRTFDILCRCPSVSEVYLNFSPYFSPLCYLTNSRETLAFQFYLNSTCTVNVIFKDSGDVKGISLAINSFIQVAKDYVSNIEETFSLTISTPFLQLFPGNKGLVSLDEVAKKNRCKVVLYCMNRNFFNNGINHINQVIGNYVTHFVLKETTCFIENGNVIEMKEHREDRTCDPMNEILPELIGNCYKIHTLNLEGIHFDNAFDFKVLHILIQLKTLCLPSCIFEPVIPKKNFINQQKEFELMVMNCNEVEYFSLFGCHKCEKGPRDKDLEAIPRWSKLKTLRLIKIKTLQFCPFLRNLSDHCPQLKILEILHVGSFLVNHYISSVMHVLENSKQLKFLKVSLDSICVRNSQFWKSLSAAKNLQGICITIGMALSITYKPIIDAVDKLQFLCLFHWNSSKVADNFKFKIMKSMKRHGVKQPKIRIPHLNINSSSCFICDSIHIY